MGGPEHQVGSMQKTPKTTLPFVIFRRTALFALSALPLSVLSGCGGGTPAEPTSPVSTAPDGTDPAPVSAAAPAPQSTSNVASGQKMLGDIPYDVWFDDPVGIVNSSQQIPTTGGASTIAGTPSGMGGSNAVAATPATTAVEPPPATTDSADWSTVISADILQAEVKSIRNFLNQNLQTVGAYNASMFEIPARTATLSAMAGIASSHSGEISWKKRAAYIRSISATMHEEKLQTGPKFQRPLLGKFEQIDEMLSGSLPGGMEEPPAEFEFAELAEMPFLMKRMEMAFNNMKTNAGSEDGFKENEEMVKHESAVLGALMKAVLTEGYGYSDDEEFLAFAKPIQDAATSMTDAVDLGNFDQYDAGLSAITKSCTQCHNIYKP